MPASTKTIRFPATTRSGDVSAIITMPDKTVALLVLAHGAGAGMAHPFMEKVASFLAVEKIATFRFNFPYMEKGRKMPDVPAVAMKTIQSAIDAASGYAVKLTVFAGGKSFGGRMTSQAAASGMIPSIKGIVFFGFPLHAPGKPGSERAAHLFDVKAPMMFLQGTRDTLADILLIRELCGKLGAKATLHEVQGGDHSFHVSKEKDKGILKEICALAAKWMKGQLE